MMRACKARAPDEGGMMKKLSGQNFNKLDNFCYVLFVVNEILILNENLNPGVIWHHPRAENKIVVTRRA